MLANHRACYVWILLINVLHATLLPILWMMIVSKHALCLCYPMMFKEYAVIVKRLA